MDAAEGSRKCLPNNTASKETHQPPPPPPPPPPPEEPPPPEPEDEPGAVEAEEIAPENALLKDEANAVGDEAINPPVYHEGE